jgi:flavin prenyltransferase
MNIIIAITGASGSIYAKRLLDKLVNRVEIHNIGVVFSKNATDVWKHELNNADYENYKSNTVTFYEPNNFLAPFASGSGNYNAMFVTPCSMGTLARIANGHSDSLITRAADVVLKERRKLICIVREAPYNIIHIKNMETVTLAGGIICPATPSFYSNPKTIEDAVDTVIDRAIHLAGIHIESYSWGNKK